MSPTHVDRMDRYHVGQELSIFRPNNGKNGVLFEVTITYKGILGQFSINGKHVVLHGISMIVHGTDDVVHAVLSSQVFDSPESHRPRSDIGLSDLVEPTTGSALINGHGVALAVYSFDNATFEALNHEGILNFEMLES